MLPAARRVWRGELPLFDAFWMWMFLGGLLVNGATTGIFYMLLAEDRAVLALVAGYGLSVPYNVFAMVGVWRAADRYRGPVLWADAARIAAVAFLLVLTVT